VAVPLSPEWWVARLFAGISERQARVAFYDAYYRGDHPLPWLAPQAREEFRRILRMTRSNYMGLVVDAMTERLQVEGFRLGPDDADGDEDTWRIWQANNLDSDSDQAILEAAITGQSYMLVAPNPRDPGTPLMWVEHPSQAIVEFTPGSSRRERAAGLKVWDDDWTGDLNATLYLPDGLYKFRADRPASGAGKPKWEPRAVAGESNPAPNPLGVVPLVELPNNPRLLLGGVSELSDVTDIQDRVNKTLADRLITQDYGSFPQKWATAWPEQDEQGNPTPPIDVGRNRMVTTEVAETRFGQFDASPLDPYSTAKREDVKDIASRTRTPAQYLLGEMSNVNGEALALDTPIPTPNGLVPIGQIVDGDLVFDEMGQVQTVEQAHPVLLDRECFRVTFDDDASFVADKGHRWAVVSIPEKSRHWAGKTRTQRSERSVMTTGDLSATLRTGNGQFAHAVEMAGAPDGPESAFPVDPYVLGVWLGDGNRHGGSICSGDEDLVEMVRLLEAAGEVVSTRTTRTVNLITSHRVGDRPALRGRLAQVGVLFDKHIPEAYFQGSLKQRLALLQGLMDTDGTASRRHGGAVALDLHDERLARDAHRLICSLGHKVPLRPSTYRKGGEQFTRWRMQWYPADVVFRLPRKAALQGNRATQRTKVVRRVIVAVEPVPSVPVRCLTVSGPSHLYLAGIEHVPTHNTLKASESGLVSKVRQRQRTYAEGLEEAVRLARRTAGLPDAGGEGMETIWRNPEFRTEGELVDALVKMASLGVPHEALWERWGASPTERARWLQMRDDAAVSDPVVTAARALTQPAVPTAQVVPGAAPGGAA
jgi:hypothetical protein